MSIHGECFDTGMSGKCGYECEVFQEGKCEEVGDLLDNIVHSGYSIQEQVELLKMYEHPSVIPWYENGEQ